MADFGAASMATPRSAEPAFSGACPDKAASTAIRHGRGRASQGRHFRAISGVPRRDVPASSKKALSFSEILYHSPYSQAVGWGMPMISTVIAMALAAAALQARHDPLGARSLHGLPAHVTWKAASRPASRPRLSQTEYPQQCATQERPSATPSFVATRRCARPGPTPKTGESRSRGCAGQLQRALRDVDGPAPQ